MPHVNISALKKTEKRGSMYFTSKLKRRKERERRSKNQPGNLLEIYYSSKVLKYETDGLLYIIFILPVILISLYILTNNN